MKRYNAIDIAKWFLWRNRVNQIENEDSNSDSYEVYEGLTHLKLQKLLYYAQGLSLAINDKKIFDDKIYAWIHGPVVKSVYDILKKFGRNEINVKLTDNDLKLIEDIENDSDTSNILNLTYDNYGIYTAWQLRQMTHEAGGPWEETVRTKGMDKEITDSLIENYFKREVIDSE